jgi:uncharacterized protein YceK
MKRWLLAWLPLLLVGLPGCGTVTSWASGCPGPYSGVRSDREMIAALFTKERAPGPEVPLGLDAPLADAWDLPFLVLDVPLAGAMDTATLPLGLALKGARPVPAGPGCAWSG